MERQATGTRNVVRRGREGIGWGCEGRDTTEDVRWHRLTLDLWLAKDNRFLNPKSSYKRILMAPSCRFIWFGRHLSGSPLTHFVCRVSPSFLRTEPNPPGEEGEEVGSKRQERRLSLSHYPPYPSLPSVLGSLVHPLMLRSLHSFTRTEGTKDRRVGRVG